MSEQKARNMTVKRVPYCKSTVNKIVKEKAKYGDLMDGPSPRTRLSAFDRLSLEMKDKIRSKVSWLFQTISTLCNFQKFGEIYDLTNTDLSSLIRNFDWIYHKVGI